MHMGHHHLVAADLIIAPKQRRQRAPRRPTLASVMRHAAKAGIEVARFEVDPTSGKIAVVVGQATAAENTATKLNPWDEVLPDAKH